MATGEVEMVVEIVNSRFESTGTGKREEITSHVANKANVPQGISASVRNTTEINTDTITYPCPTIASGALLL